MSTTKYLGWSADWKYNPIEYVHHLKNCPDGNSRCTVVYPDGSRTYVCLDCSISWSVEKIMSPFNFNLERERMVDELNESRLTRAILESEYGQVWSTDELCQMFVVEGFLAPFCVVRNKKTGQRGTVKFQHSPRFYFSFQPE